MLGPLPQFKSVVTLVPHSGIQFLDFGLNIDPPLRVNCSFVEEREAGKSDGLLTLQAMVTEEGELRHAVSGEPVHGDPTYSFNAARGLEAFVEKWVPVPFLRSLGQDARGREVLDEGPTNWARVWVTELPERDSSGNAYRVILAFDTALEARQRAEGEPYPAPTVEDATIEEEFAFSAHVADVGGFASEAWVDEWLEQCLLEFRQSRQRGRAPRAAQESTLEHTARYLTFLSVLEQGCKFPRVRLVDAVSKERSYVPISVDLVIDVGKPHLPSSSLTPTKVTAST
jgi:hypothetical protein